MTIIIVILLTVSCQNETKDSKLNWVQKTGNIVLQYDKNAEVELSKVIYEDDMKTELTRYKKNNNGVFKSIVESHISENLTLKIVFCTISF